MQADTLKTLQMSLLAEIANAGDLGTIEAVRISALGRRGRIPELMQKLGGLPADERKPFGAAVNALKSVVGEALETRKSELEVSALSTRLSSERADITLPVRPGPPANGRIHPVSQVFDEIKHQDAVFRHDADADDRAEEGNDI